MLISSLQRKGEIDVLVKWHVYSLRMIILEDRSERMSQMVTRRGRYGGNPVRLVSFPGWEIWSVLFGRIWQF